MENFYDEGLNFSCKRCSFCCGNSPMYVYLSERDLKILAEHYELSEDDFINKYCRWVMYYGGVEVLALLQEKNYDCVMWSKGCSAYEARPVQCSTYPFWSWMIKDEKIWNECAEDCPGMNSGKLWTKAEIDEQKKLFEENPPLKKDEYYKTKYE